MKPYLIKTTFDCIRAGEKFRYEPVGITYLKTELIVINYGCKLNCVNIKTGKAMYATGKSNIYVKG